MKKGISFTLALTGLMCLASMVAHAGKTVMVNGQERPAYREGEVIVKYRPAAIRSLRASEDLYERIQVVSVRRFSGKFQNFEHLFFNTEKLNVEEAVADLQRDPNVEYVQPNYMIYALEAQPEVQAGKPCYIPGLPFPPGCNTNVKPRPPSQPSRPTNPPVAARRPEIKPAPSEVNPPKVDPNLDRAWGIEKVGADKAWATQRGSKNVIVAVIDTGIDYNHPDLAANMWRNPSSRNARTGVDANGDQYVGDVVGWDFVHNDNLPFDDNQHGTHCAGTIGAVGGDGQGISGVAQKVSLMAVKFLDAAGSGDTADAIKGIDYAVSRGAKVLSNSWGGGADEGNDALKDAIERAGDAGVLFVAAAGNDSADNDRDPMYPAAFNLENMITVAATTKNDGLAYFSNTGLKTVHVGAPGNGIYSTTPNGRYSSLSGTSMACPHVAGAAALVWSQFPNADYKEVKRRLLESGDRLSVLEGRTITGKRINVQKALQL